MMLTLVGVGGPPPEGQRFSIGVVFCSEITGLYVFGGNEWLQLSFCARGRSLWSVNERPVESVGGQENG